MLGKAPEVTATVDDFKITQKIGDGEVTEVTPTSVQLDSSDSSNKTYKIMFQEIQSGAEAQTVTMTVAYKNTAAKTATFTLAEAVTITEAYTDALYQVRVKLAGPVEGVKASDVKLKDADGGLVDVNVAGLGTGELVLTTANFGLLTEGAKLTVKVKNSEKELVVGDTVKPVIESANAINTRQVKIVFSERLSNGTGGAPGFVPSNFAIRNTMTGASAQLKATNGSTAVVQEDLKTVIITLGATDIEDNDGSTTLRPDVFASGIGLRDSSVEYEVIFTHAAATIYDTNNNNVINGTKVSFAGTTSLDAEAPVVSEAEYNQANQMLTLVFDEPILDGLADKARADENLNKIILSAGDVTATLITDNMANADTTGDTKSDDVSSIKDNKVAIQLGDTSKAIVEAMITAGNEITVAVERDLVRDLNQNPNETLSGQAVTIVNDQPTIKVAVYNDKTDRISMTFDRVIDIAQSKLTNGNGFDQLSITGRDAFGSNIGAVLSNSQTTTITASNASTIVLELAKIGDPDASDSIREVIECIKTDGKVIIEATALQDLNGRKNGSRIEAPLTVENNALELTVAEYNKTVNDGTLSLSFSEKVSPYINMTKISLAITDNGTTKEYRLTKNGLATGEAYAVTDAATGNKKKLDITINTGVVANALKSATVTEIKLITKAAKTITDESGEGLEAGLEKVITVTEDYGTRQLNFGRPYGMNVGQVAVRAEVKLNPSTLQKENFYFKNSSATVLDVELLSDEQTVVLTLNEDPASTDELIIDKKVRAKVGDLPTKDAHLTTATVNGIGNVIRPVISATANLSSPVGQNVNIVDEDSSNSPSQGDKVSIDFNTPIQLLRALTNADFTVTGSRTLGTGWTAKIDETYPNRLTITLGSNPTIGVNDTITPIDGTTLTSKGIVAKGMVGYNVAGNAVDSNNAATLMPPAGVVEPVTMQTIKYYDANGNGLKDKGDYMVLEFSGDINQAAGAGAVLNAMGSSNFGGIDFTTTTGNWSASFIDGGRNKVKIEVAISVDTATSKIADITFGGTTPTNQMQIDGTLKSTWGGAIAAKNLPVILEGGAVVGNPSITKAEFIDLGKRRGSGNEAGINEGSKTTDLDVLVLTFDRPVTPTGTITAGDIKFGANNLAIDDWNIVQPFIDKSKLLLINRGASADITPDSTEFVYAQTNTQLEFADINGKKLANQSIKITSGNADALLTGFDAGYYTALEDGTKVFEKADDWNAASSSAGTAVFLIGTLTNQPKIDLTTGTAKVELFGLPGYSKLDAGVVADNTTTYIGGIEFDATATNKVGANAVISANTPAAFTVEQNQFSMSSRNGFVTKAVYLSGAATGAVIIRDNVVSGSGAIAIDLEAAVQAQNVTINFNDIYGCFAGIGLNIGTTDAKVYTIQSNTIHSVGTVGIHLKGAGATGTTVNLSANDIKAYGTKAVNSKEYGILLDDKLALTGATLNGGTATTEATQWVNLNSSNTIVSKADNDLNRGVSDGYGIMIGTAMQIGPTGTDVRGKNANDNLDAAGYITKTRVLTVQDGENEYSIDGGETWHSFTSTVAIPQDKADALNAAAGILVRVAAIANTSVAGEAEVIKLTAAGNNQIVIVKADATTNTINLTGTTGGVIGAFEARVGTSGAWTTLTGSFNAATGLTFETGDTIQIRLAATAGSQVLPGSIREVTAQ